MGLSLGVFARGWLWTTFRRGDRAVYTEVTPGTGMARERTDCLAGDGLLRFRRRTLLECHACAPAQREGLLMRRPNRLTMPLALSAAAALLLTGCTGGGDGGDESPSPTAGQSTSAPVSESPGGGSESATPTESATPEPATSTSAAKNIPAPEMPDAMKKNDQAGLEAALEYWWETEHYAKSTGDVVPMEEVSEPGCQVCDHIIENWPAVYDAGGWAVVQPASVDDIIANVDNGGTGGTYLFTTTTRPSQLYRPGGELVEDGSSAGNRDAPWSGSAVFDHSAGHWLIENLTVMAGS